ncbi:histidine kinase N-terminal domain-containing protein [Metabacillus herbersteinensis]|uniref:histidine kinase n=1 Tax=Metabacillus herbersteinensis TaxID=283816 RepID=A0ABV6GGH8_9BACI
MSSPQLLIDFLEKNTADFFESWLTTIYIEPEDVYFHRIKGNGISMYELVKRNLLNPLSEDEIKQLASKVAVERVKANINIGDFVFNVNSGRSIIIKYVNQSGLKIEELQQHIDDINKLFDQFCFHAVTNYTELKEQQLIDKDSFINQTHKDRLSLLGQMSSSFVHEFRNPLTAIIGFIKLLKDEDQNLKYINIIEHELEQLKFKITQFLHVSKKQVTTSGKTEISFVNLFDELLNFLYPSLLDGDVDVQSEISRDLIIEANKEELRQVCINLILNSIDALKQVEKPRNIQLSVEDFQNQVTLNITNNGPDLSQDEINVIFEPFYTTKEMGTGIGLYVCKEIVEKNDGTISCSSGNGLTTFSISLPKCSKKKISEKQEML